MKSILFLLPGRGNTPVGGFKIIYEYANRLADDGYDVTLIYPALILDEFLSVIQKIRGFFRYIRVFRQKNFSCKPWFTLNEKITEKWVYRLKVNQLKKKDVVIATAAETAWFLQRYAATDQSRYYLIQHFENWVDKTILDSTWKSGLKKIVIADWLMDIAHSYNTEAVLIENGLDFSVFKIKTNIEQKNKFSITMLWHQAENKGSMDGFEALSIVHQKHPGLKAFFFGIPEKPDFLPDWIQYFKQPDTQDLVELYNRSAIFVAPSRSEGFGLTAAEAMQCGCAVTSTNAGGFLQFCKNDSTALVSGIKNPLLLARNIERLIEDDPLRFFIAHNGNAFIQQFSWPRAYLKFKQYLEL